MFQVIIDECGMCKEAECLVPVVSCRPQQVVLIGDHQQLQPIILNKTAQNFGLDRSLFERYATSAHMLTMQYRMVRHRACCDILTGLKLELDVTYRVFLLLNEKYSVCVMNACF